MSTCGFARRAGEPTTRLYIPLPPLPHVASRAGVEGYPARTALLFSVAINQSHLFHHFITSKKHLLTPHAPRPGPQHTHTPSSPLPPSGTSEPVRGPGSPRCRPTTRPGRPRTSEAATRTLWASGRPSSRSMPPPRGSLSPASASISDTSLVTTILTGAFVTGRVCVPVPCYRLPPLLFFIIVIGGGAGVYVCSVFFYQ